MPSIFVLVRTWPAIRGAGVHAWVVAPVCSLGLNCVAWCVLSIRVVSAHHFHIRRSSALLLAVPHELVLMHWT